MNLRQLKTLIAIAEHGTLAKAADAIALTPSAVSQQMTSLEDEVGIALFDRTTRPPTLTYQGQQLLDGAKVITQTAESVLNAIKGENMAGAFNIGAVRTSIFGFLPRAVSALKKEYPMLKINLRMGHSDDLMFDVSAGRLDAALIAEPETLFPKLDFKAFIEEPFIAISQPGREYDSAYEMLTSQEYIHFKKNVPLARIIDSELTRQGIHTKSSVQLDSIYGIIQCVSNGLGASVVPATSVTHPFPFDVYSVPFGTEKTIRRIGIVKAKNSPKDFLVDILHERLAYLSGPYGKF
ncbi:MAG: LysR family transcriptional regulator [Desulfuromonadales bacterium]|nr:LysR family transcriptional regulator [Desulfuromonadales bacterium]MBN2792029.1 LysR family transcriptional regulator [Desulfuromonadales bacterium]